MKNPNGVSLKALYTRNRDKYIRTTKKEDDLSQSQTQTSVSTTTIQNESKIASETTTPSTTTSIATATPTSSKHIPHQYYLNPSISYSRQPNKSNNTNYKDAYLNQTISNFIEDDSQTQLKTVDSNTSSSNCLPQKNKANSKTTKCFIPLSKLSLASIANVSKIIPSITSRRTGKDNEGFKPKESFMYQPPGRTLNNKRNLLNQLVRNQEHNVKNTLNQTMYDTTTNNNINDISICSSTITSSSNIPPVSETNTCGNNNTSTNNKGSNHKRELSIISLESTPDAIIISHEDLLLIEDKLHDILSLIELGHVAQSECFEWWNYYFNSSLAGKYEEYYLNDDNKKKIRSYVNIELLCVMLCYTISLNKEAFAKYNKDLKAIFSFLHFNLLLMIKMIITKQKGNDSSSAKLALMIKKSLTFLKENEIEEFFMSSLITHNINSVSELFLSIIDNEYKTKTNTKDCCPLSNFFTVSYQKRLSMTVEEYNDFFRLNILKVSNPEGSILASSLSKLSEDLRAKQKPKVPFLSITSKYKYTLVLDLDETLVHLRENSGNTANNNNHKLFLRPNLIPFLQKVKKKFELVVFTAGTQDYADKIINVIEKKERFFSHRLYREHTLVVGNDFIKDLTKLGRDLSRMVIVDNMPQNYRLQKENGIFIKAFFGDNPNDSALTHLGDILMKIVQENGDIRKGLLKYKDDIVSMVSLNKII